MLNKFIKKSIASKLFLMNLFILICIVMSQLVFQALYFEKYYLSQKKNILENTLQDFKTLLGSENNKEKIIGFIQDVKKKENIAISFKDSELSSGIGIEPYMGSRYIKLNDKNNKGYKVILGDQFPKIDVKKNDYVQVYGNINEYGYIFPQKILINDVELEAYYDIVPSRIMDNTAAQVLPAISTSLESESYVEGRAENLVNEDDTYLSFSNIDLYLSLQEKENIIANNKYTAKVNNTNSMDDILISSESFAGGYVIAITPLAQVNEVIGTMNSYYFIIFIVVFLLVVVISLIYSRFMTKPLVEMSYIAKKISECDFEYKYNVKSEDEIGVLGKSLNLISNNLEKSLNNLQETNEKLTNEMNIQKVQEEKRKELIANISHELKTPITIIQGSINGIKSGMYRSDMYEDILEETNKMNELVREMLEISKLESPNFKLEKVPFDLGSVFLKEKDKLSGMINEKSLEMNYNDFDEMIVVGDEKRINQVVTNLLTNAIKYTPDRGKINVSIDLFEEDKYIFSIENFGAALTEEELEKVWDPFYRGEKSRNKRFGGTGLGLSIVKKILEIHNSDYAVESTKNSVRFSFTILRCVDY